MSECIILRGIPGSGKSFATSKYSDYVYCSADTFFQKDNMYNFDPKKLGIAHRICQQKFSAAILAGSNVIVDNTNLNTSDITTYLKIVDSNYIIKIIDVEYNSLEEAIDYRSNNSSGKNLEESRMREMYYKYTNKGYIQHIKEHYPDLNITFETLKKDG